MRAVARWASTVDQATHVVPLEPTTPGATVVLLLASTAIVQAVPAGWQLTQLVLDRQSVKIAVLPGSAHTESLTEVAVTVSVARQLVVAGVEDRMVDDAVTLTAFKQGSPGTNDLSWTVGPFTASGDAGLVALFAARGGSQSIPAAVATAVADSGDGKSSTAPTAETLRAWLAPLDAPVELANATVTVPFTTNQPGLALNTGSAVVTWTPQAPPAPRPGMGIGVAGRWYPVVPPGAPWLRSVPVGQEPPITGQERAGDLCAITDDAGHLFGWSVFQRGAWVPPRPPDAPVHVSELATPPRDSAMGLWLIAPAGGLRPEPPDSTTAWDLGAGWYARNTGVPPGAVLTPSGPLTVTTPGAVLDGLDITGNVDVQAAGVVIRNCRITGAGAYGVLTRVGASVTITDCEISGHENAIGFDNWTAIRVNIHSTYGDGVKLGSNVYLRDCWVHDLAPGVDAHADGGQVQSGIGNTLVKRNWIDMAFPNANAALLVAPDLGPDGPGPLTMEGNYLDGGNYTVYIVDGNNGQYHIADITFRDNAFGRTHTYGPMNVNVPVTLSGNRYSDGQPI